MSDLISRSALAEEVKSLRVTVTGLRGGKCIQNEYLEQYKDTLLRVIEEQPTIEAVPVVHGEWIHIESSDMVIGRAYKCSNCEKIRYGSFIPPYCQICGAKMNVKVGEVK